MAMEFSADISTLIVALVAGIWTVVTLVASVRSGRAAKTEEAQRREALERRKSAQAERRRERQARQDTLDMRELLQRDVMEAHEILKDLGDHSIVSALHRPEDPVNQVLLELAHRRLAVRWSDLQSRSGEQAEADGDSEADGEVPAALEPYAAPIEDGLRRVAAAAGLSGASTHEPNAAPRPAAVPARDFTKYRWNGSPEKHGKGAMLSLIGVRFVRENGIASVKDFESRFGDVLVALFPDEVGPRQFDRTALLSPLFQEGQRERYAIANRRWRDVHGSDGVITLDGAEYLIAWSLGFKGAGVAALQKKVIEYFRKQGYPIETVAGSSSV